MKIYKEEPDKYGWYRVVKYRSTMKDFTFAIYLTNLNTPIKPIFQCDAKFMKTIMVFFKKELEQ